MEIIQLRFDRKHFALDFDVVDRRFGLAGGLVPSRFLEKVSVVDLRQELFELPGWLFVAAVSRRHNSLGLHIWDHDLDLRTLGGLRGYRSIRLLSAFEPIRETTRLKLILGTILRFFILLSVFN